MKRLLPVLSLTALVSSAAQSAQIATPEQLGAGEIAVRVVQQLQARPFGRSRADWRTNATTAVWRHFLGNPDWHPVPTDGLGQLWCAVAQDAELGIARQAAFFALRDHEPLDCRLEQLRYEIRGLPAAHAALKDAFVKAFGIPGEVYTDSPLARAVPSARNAMRWSDMPFDVVLYRTDDAVGVLSRHRTLNNALSQESSAFHWEWAPPTERKHRRLFATHYPEAYELARNSGPFAETDAVVRNVEKILHDMQAAQSAERAWRALAANELLMRLFFDGGPPPNGRPEMNRLRRFDLRFENFEFGAWRYAGGLAEGVIKKHGATEWGRLARVRQIVGGWSDECSDIYRHVVAHGVEWLKHHPQSEYRGQMIEAVAQAYETWWSLSLAPEHDELAADSAAEAARGARRARIEAIKWYDTLLETHSGTFAALQAERRVRHLRLGVDTAQRRYHCQIS